MTVSRRDKLQAMLTDDPDDQMLRYMLATELEKEGEHDGSLELFRGLMDASQPYVPAFLMAGQQLARLGRIEDARATYQRGIQAAQNVSDEHAAGEMSQFLAELSG